MEIITKMSGWTIKGIDIEYIFDDQLVSLADCMRKIRRQTTMNFILDNFRFYNSDKAGVWYAILDSDTIAKISIMENYPEIEKELTDYFGKEWNKCYLRFGH
jgi:hypothetical protein